MNFSKLIKSIFLIFLTLLFSGCIHSVNKQGLVMSLSESSLSSSLEKKFPIKKDFILGKIAIENPKVSLPKHSGKIKIGIDLSLSSLFTPTQKGSFFISGIPSFKKENQSIYLKEIKIEEIKYGQIRLGDTVTKTFLSIFEPMVNDVFKNYPIYTIPKDSFQGTFVKNLKIEDSQLLVTYGL